MAAAGGKWIPVVHNFNKKKKMPMVSAMATEKSYVSSNSFTLLTNHTENQTVEINPRSNCEWPSATNSMKKKNIIQPSAGNKIPTIINGRVTNVETKTPSSSLKISSHVPGNKINRYDHKVKIIGDSHLTGSAARIIQYLNTKFEICSFIKPGACTNQIVHSQEMEFMSLGRKDAIIINGGTNDIGNTSTKKKKTLVIMTQFMQKYNNSNIVFVNIPMRHDLKRTLGQTLKFR